MAKIHNPPELNTLKYSIHGMEVREGARTLYITGQIAIDQDGQVPSGIRAQTELVYAKIRAVLRSAGMDFENMVRTTVFLVHPGDHPEFVKTRIRILGDFKNTSSLVFVNGIPGPENLLVEVDAIATDEGS